MLDFERTFSTAINTKRSSFTLFSKSVKINIPQFPMNLENLKRLVFRMHSQGKQLSLEDFVVKVCTAFYKVKVWLSAACKTVLVRDVVSL